MKFADGLKLTLRIIAKSMDFLPRENLFDFVPKGCPGCLTLNILLCASVCKELISEVENTFKQLLNDPNSRIVENGKVKETSNSAIWKSLVLDNKGLLKVSDSPV